MRGPVDREVAGEWCEGGLISEEGARAYWQTMNGTSLSLCASISTLWLFVICVLIRLMLPPRSSAFKTNTSLVFKRTLRVKLGAARTRLDHGH